MKNIILIISLLCFSAFAQQQEQKDLLHLKSELKSSNYNSSSALLNQAPTEFKKKNAGLAIIYSLLLPGMGELYAESYQSGKYFTIAEGVLWGTYIGFNTYGNWQKNRYKSFAASKARVDINGKDDDYFSIIGEYISVEQYNNEKVLERDYGGMLDEKTHYWKWTNEDRKTYRSMWVSSEHAFNNLRFVVGAMIINRIASAVNAVRLTAAYNRRESEQIGWNIWAEVENSINLPNNFTINFQTSF